MQGVFMLDEKIQYLIPRDFRALFSTIVDTSGRLPSI